MPPLDGSLRVAPGTKLAPDTKFRAYSRIEFKQLADDPTKTWFEGWASTPTPDRGGDSLNPKGAQFKLPMPFLDHHDAERPLGLITEGKVSAKGIYVKGYIDKVDGPPTLKERLDVARVEMQRGMRRGLSVGFLPLGDLGDGYDFNKVGGIDFESWEMVELSGVTIPMNAEATITMIKSLAKGASGSTDLPLSDRTHPWDAPSADAAVRKWASSDGSGDKDKISWTKYGSAHFWTDTEPAGEDYNLGDFKLGFSDVIGGGLTAVWRGVTAAAAVMQGARGGVDIPDADRPGVRAKIEAYYAKARQKYKDDTIQVPWASDGKGAGAASGTVPLRGAARPTSPPGVAGHPQPSKGTAMATLAERISSWEAKRAALVAQRANIMEVAEKDGDRALSTEEAEEVDGIKVDIERADGMIKRLRDDETINKAAAVPVPAAAGADADKGSKTRQGEIILKPNSNLPPGIGMARYVKAFAFAKGNYSQAAEYAKQWETSTPEVALALKTAVAAGTSTDSAWAGPLVYAQDFPAAFLEFLRPLTIIGKLTGLSMVPFNIRYGIQDGGSTVGWVGQGVGKPVTTLHFTSGSLGFAKAAGIVVITQELARFSSPSAELKVRDDLTAQMQQFLDQQFIDPSVAAVANVSPASVLNGASNVQQSTGAWTTMANVLTDVKALLRVFAANEISLQGAYWIMTPDTALSLGLLLNTGGTAFAFPEINVNGGNFVGLPVIVSNSVPHSTSAGAIVALVVPKWINMADDGQVAIDTSTEASLQMDTAPTQTSATPTASTLVSMFQTNSIAVRVERVINWQRARTYAVGYIDNMHTA